MLSADVDPLTLPTTVKEESGNPEDMFPMIDLFNTIQIV